MKHLKKSLSLLLAALLLCSLTGFAAGPARAAEGKAPQNAGSSFAETAQLFQTGNRARFLAPGIEENEIYLNDKTGNSQRRIHTVTVDPKTEGVGFLAGYADYGQDGWKMQSVRDQAYHAEKATGRNIVAAFNTDIYNMETGEPVNSLVLGGRVVKAAVGLPYFGVTKSGEIVMGRALSQELLDEMQECAGASWPDAMLVENGQRTPWGSKNDGAAPRSAVGLKEDGTFVFVCLEGRNFPFAQDSSFYDLASVMLGIGCVTAINLDGGGSSTYLSKGPGDPYLMLRSHPSDAVERAVSSAFFVTYDGPAFEAPSGEEAHEHDYVYENGKLTCACGETRESAGYTGFAKDGPTGRTRYFIKGEAKKGWFVYREDCYYFDKDTGLGHVGPLTTYSGNKARDYVFDEEGKQAGPAIVYAAAGFPRAYFADGMITGWYKVNDRWHFSFDKGFKLKSVSNSLVRMYGGYETYYGGILMGGVRTVFVPTHADSEDGGRDSFDYTFDDDGNLIQGALAKVENNKVYYWGYERYIGWAEIDGATHYFAPPCGFMATGEIEIDGEKCTFDSDGKLLHGHGLHDWGEWEETKAPTVTAEGEETRECAVCHRTETRVLPRLTFTPGDVDKDGSVTAADARLALRRAVDLETYEPGSPEFSACDVDRDESVTAADARRILRAAVDLERLDAQ